jgi:hypothetical protein
MADFAKGLPQQRETLRARVAGQPVDQLVDHIVRYRAARLSAFLIVHAVLISAAWHWLSAIERLARLVVEVGQQRRQPREADEKFARARMVLAGHGVELVQGGDDGVDVGHAPFVRDGRGGQTYQIHFEARWVGAERRVP